MDTAQHTPMDPVERLFSEVKDGTYPETGGTLVAAYSSGIICTQEDLNAAERHYAHLRADNERLRTALAECVTEHGATCMQDGLGRQRRRIEAINAVARAVLAGEEHKASTSEIS